MDKCYIIVVIWALVVYLIYAPSALGLWVYIRLKSIVLLNSPIILFRIFFKNLLIILKIIPTFSQLFPQKVVLFSKTHANILIKHKQLYLVIISTINKHEKLSAGRDLFNCNHRYAKYLIVWDYV